MMKTLIISENSPFSSFLQDFIYLMKPDEVVELTDLHSGLAQCYFYSPDVVLYDFDLLGFRITWFIENLSSILSSDRIIIGFTDKITQSMNKQLDGLSNSVFSKDDAVNQLGLIYSGHLLNKDEYLTKKTRGF